MIAELIKSFCLSAVFTFFAATFYLSIIFPLTFVCDSGTQSLNQVMNILGLEFAAPMGLAYVTGFMKG